MEIYIAFLRGINVGTQNRIKMQDLKTAFESLGFKAVQTYLQSGNVLFQTHLPEDGLNVLVESKIESSFGFHSSVIIRSAKQLNTLLDACPYPEEAVKEAEAVSKTESLYAVLLQTPPQADLTNRILSYRTEADDCTVINREIYLLLRHSIRESKLAGIISKWIPAMTVRNFNTLRKLRELAAGME